MTFWTLVSAKSYDVKSYSSSGKRDVEAYDFKRKETLNGISGSVFAGTKDNSLEIFIPDVASDSRTTMIRKRTGDTWEGWRNHVIIKDLLIATFAAFPSQRPTQSKAPAVSNIGRPPSAGARKAQPGTQGGWPAKFTLGSSGTTIETVWTLSTPTRYEITDRASGKDNFGPFYFDRKEVVNGIQGAIFIDGTHKGEHPSERFIPNVNSSSRRSLQRHFYDGGWLPWQFNGTIRDIIVTRAEVATQERIARNKVPLGAIHEAVERGDTTAVKQMVSRDKSCLYEAKSGMLPLHTAVQKRNLAMVQILVQGGANVNAPARNGYSPLHYCHSMNLQIATYLVSKKASVNARDNDGRTPLFIAVNIADYNFAKFLLDHRANPSAVDRRGDTPLHYLLQWAHQSKNIATLLKTRGANLRAENGQGYTPSELARLSGNVILADLLRPR